MAPLSHVPYQRESHQHLADEEPFVPHLPPEGQQQYAGAHSQRTRAVGARGNTLGVHGPESSSSTVSSSSSTVSSLLSSNGLYSSSSSTVLLVVLLFNGIARRLQRYCSSSSSTVLLVFKRVITRRLTIVVTVVNGIVVTVFNGIVVVFNGIVHTDRNRQTGYTRRLQRYRRYCRPDASRTPRRCCSFSLLFCC